MIRRQKRTAQKRRPPKQSTGRSARPKSGGGRLASLALEYQNRYGAYLATRILDDESAPESWKLPSGTTIVKVFMEQDASVDDVLCVTSHGGFAFVQVKKSLAVDTRKDSGFRKLVRAIVDLFVNFGDQIVREGFPRRPFDPAQDRIVLAIGKASSVKEIVEACDAARSQQSFAKRPRTKKIEAARKKWLAVVREYWSEIANAEATDTDLQSILGALYVHECACIDGGADEDRALERLGHIVLPHLKAKPVWDRLIGTFAAASSRGKGFDKDTLIEEIRPIAGVLSARADHRADRATLRARSSEFVDWYRDKAYLALPGSEIQLRRGTQATLRAEAVAGSLLLIGDPGIGKTGATVSLFAACKQDTEEVVYLPVERLRDWRPLNEQLQLNTPLAALFREWAVEKPAYLIVDGLDSVRGNEELNKILADLYEVRRAAPSEWRFIASMRRFDADRAIRRDAPLKRVFGRASGESRGPLHRDLVTFEVPELDDADLAEVENALPAAKNALSIPAVQKLARTPFNLQLLVSVIRSGAAGAEMIGLRTQLDLLNLYWDRRIRSDDGETERVLALACESMIRRMDMHFSEQDTPLPAARSVLTELCSRGVLIELRTQSALSDPTYRFVHNVLLDFSLAKLVLRQSDGLRETLAQNPGALTIIAPALRMVFADLWEQSPTRDEFWTLLFELAEDSRIPVVADLLAIAVGSRNAVAAQDLQHLVRTLGSTSSRATALKIIAWITSSLQVGDLDPFVRSGDPWAGLALVLAEAPADGSDFQSLRLQGLLLEQADRLSPEAGESLAIASRALLLHWLASRNDRQLAVAIDHVLRTFPFDAAGNGKAVRHLIEADSFAEHAWNDGPALARQLASVHTLDPALVSEVYAAIFKSQTDSRAKVDMTQSRIFGFTSNRRQDLDHAKWQLGQDFPRFFDASPEYATEAMLAASHAYRRIAQPLAAQPKARITFDGATYDAAVDDSAVWLGTILTQHKPEIQMLDDWFGKMLALRQTNRSRFKTCLRKYCAGADSLAYWRQLLHVAAENPETLGMDVFDALCDRSLLFASDTTEKAASCISSVYPHLSRPQRERIEKAILT